MIGHASLNLQDDVGSNDTQVNKAPSVKLNAKFNNVTKCHAIFFCSLIQDAAEVKRICGIYDWHGKGTLDMFYFMDIFYALGLNIIKKVCVKYGQTDELEKKFCSFDEVVSLMQQAVKEPNHSGNYHDFIELCKLYDKNENGTIMLAELDNFLNLLGKFLNVSRFNSVLFPI